MAGFHKGQKGWRPCVAPTPDRCPIGGNHLNTQQEVNAAIEAEMAAEHDSFSTQKSKKTTESEVRKPEDIRADLDDANERAYRDMVDWESADSGTFDENQKKSLWRASERDVRELKEELKRSEEVHPPQEDTIKSVSEELQGVRSYLNILNEELDDGVIGIEKYGKDSAGHIRKEAELQKKLYDLKNKENKKETESLIPRDKEGSFGRFDSAEEYYAATDKKHFNGGDGSGSAFTDSVKNLNELVDIARMQRGGLDGDDREHFIRDGANPDAFLSTDKARYLRVQAPGHNSKIGIGDVDVGDDEPVFTAEESKSGNISLSVERGEFKKESYGTLIIGKEDDGGEIVWTAHPGAPAKSSGRGTFNGFKPGQKVSRKQIREMAGTDDVQVTIRKPAPPSASSQSLRRMRASGGSKPLPAVTNASGGNEEITPRLKRALGRPDARERRREAFERSRARKWNTASEGDAVIQYGLTRLPNTKPKSKKGIVQGAYAESIESIDLINRKKAIPESEYENVFKKALSRSKIDEGNPRKSMEDILRNTVAEAQASIGGTSQISRSAS